MKKLFIGLVALLSTTSLFAQTGQSITVRTDSGTEDVIDLPEGMLSNSDSLYLDWISKNYINLGDNCIPTSAGPQISDWHTYL